MKILLIHSKYLPIFNKKMSGGIEKIERTYLQYNEKIGDDFVVYSPKIAKDNYDCKKLKHTSFRNIDLTTKKSIVVKYIFAIKNRIQHAKNNEYYIRQVIRDLKKRREENSYDLIIFENEEGSIPLFKKKTKTTTKIVLHLHNDYINVERKNSRTILENCNEVWCVSKYIESRVKEVLEIKTLVIPNMFSSVSCNRNIVSKLKEKYRTKNNMVYAYLGRLRENKGVKQLIESFNNVAANSNDNRLLLIGDYDEGKKEKRFKKEIEKSIEGRNNITHIEYVGQDNIINYLSIADILVVPSICNEAFGMVVLEGMQAGVHIIATRTGGIPEVGGNTIRYIEKEGLVKKLTEEMGNPIYRKSCPKGKYLTQLRQYTEKDFTNNFYGAIHGQKNH